MEQLDKAMADLVRMGESHNEMAMLAVQLSPLQEAPRIFRCSICPRTKKKARQNLSKTFQWLGSRLVSKASGSFRVASVRYIFSSAKIAGFDGIVDGYFVLTCWTPLQRKPKWSVIRRLY